MGWWDRLDRRTISDRVATSPRSTRGASRDRAPAGRARLIDWGMLRPALGLALLLALAPAVPGDAAAQARQRLYSTVAPPGYTPLGPTRDRLRADLPLVIGGRSGAPDDGAPGGEIVRCRGCPFRPPPRTFRSAARAPRLPALVALRPLANGPRRALEGAPRLPVEPMLHEDILNPEALDLYRANRNRYSRFRLYEVRLDGAPKFLLLLRERSGAWRCLATPPRPSGDDAPARTERSPGSVETLLDGGALCSLWTPELNANRRPPG